MPNTVACPYCQKVNELKNAKSGQHIPYMRCLDCNLLIWFYGGVPKKSAPKNEVVKEKSFLAKAWGLK